MVGWRQAVHDEFLVLLDVAEAVLHLLVVLRYKLLVVLARLVVTHLCGMHWLVVGHERLGSGLLLVFG